MISNYDSVQQILNLPASCYLKLVRELSGYVLNMFPHELGMEYSECSYVVCALL